MLKKHKISLQKKGLAHLVFLLGFAAPIVTSSLVTVPKAIAQPIRKAVVFAPPSNIRAVPNGQILCSVRSTTSINIYSYRDGWYETDYCGSGYIHQSQVKFPQ